MPTETLKCVRAITWRSDERTEVLLVQRAPDDGHKPLHWECPGGKVDGVNVDTDQALRLELMRELQEEIGTKPDLDEKYTIKITQSIPHKHPLYPGLFVTMFYHGILHGDITLSHEHVDYRFVTLDKLSTYTLTPVTRMAFESLPNRD